MKKIIFIYSLLLLSITDIAQPVWYFGKNAGIRFSNNSSSLPTAFGNMVSNPISTEEGCAIVHDNSGNVIISTDGVTVYNKNRLPMPNGTGLYGNSSSTQSAIIVPVPGCCSKYFLFTTDYVNGINGFNYSVIDISLNNGLGDVVSGRKNLPLITSQSAAPFNGLTSEKLTAIQDGNGGYWVVTKGKSGTGTATKFYAFHITAQNTGSCNDPSVNTSPGSYTISSDPSWSTGDLGQLKISPDNKHIATTGYSDLSLFLWDFDINTGIISNLRKTTMSAYDYLYGLEFSPDSKTIYFSSIYFNLYLYSVQFTNSTIGAVNTIYYTTSNETGNFTKYRFGSLQLGHDGRIYAANGGSASPPNPKYIGVIQTPNSFTNPNYVHNGIVLPTGSASSLSLPTFLLHTYCTPCDTVSMNIVVNKTNSGNGAGNGTVSVSVIGNTGPYSHSWNNGASTATLSNLSEGLYSDTVSDATGCKRVEEIYICSPSTISFSNSFGTSNCSYNLGSATVTVTGNNYPFTHSWSTNPVTTGSMLISKPFGTYYDTITDSRGCKVIDTVVLSCLCNNAAQLGPDINICNGQTVTLGTPGIAGHTYQWGVIGSNMSYNTSTITVTPNSTTTYYLKATTQTPFCQKSDTIKVIVNNCSPCPTCTGNTEYYTSNGPQIFSKISNNLSCGSYDINYAGLVCTPALNLSDYSLTIYDATGNTLPWFSTGVLTIPQNTNGNYKFVIRWKQSGLTTVYCDSIIYPLTVTCPPCCPEISQSFVNLSGHCILKDTIQNLCNKNISSWTLAVNGSPYAGTSLAPQSISANTNLPIDLTFTNIAVPTGTLIYTFTFADGTVCTVSKTYDITNCTPPPCNNNQCSGNITIKRGAVFVPWNSILTLTCDSLYSTNPVYTCNPPSNNFIAAPPTIRDNFNATYPWPSGAAFPNLKIPVSWPANRTYTITFKWISTTDSTCAVNQSVQFVLKCFPCGNPCAPVINATSQSKPTQILELNNNFSAVFNCGTYTLTPDLNCTLPNNTVIKNVKLLNATNNIVTSIPSWLAAIMNANGSGIFTVPQGFSGIYKIRYYYGTSTSSIPCDSITAILNFSCMDCCSGGQWVQKPKLTYAYSSQAFYTLDCSNPELLLLKSPKIHCDSSLKISGVYACGTTGGCISSIEYSILDPATLAPVLTASNSLIIPSSLPAGDYLVKYKVYCGTQVCDSCVFEMEKEPCIQNPCATFSCSPFIALTGNSNQVLLLNQSNSYEANVTCNKPLSFTINSYNCNPAPSTPITCKSVSVYGPSSSYALTSWASNFINSCGTIPLTIPSTVNNGDQFRVVFRYGTGNNTCDSVIVTLKVTCSNTPATCQCAALSPLKYALNGTSYQNNSGGTITIPCGSINKFYRNAIYAPDLCNGIMLKAELKDVAGNILNAAGTGTDISNPISYSFPNSTGSVYTLTYTLLQGMNVCSSQTVTIITSCQTTDCCTGAIWSAFPVVRENGIKTQQLDCKTKTPIEINTLRGNCDKSITIQGGLFTCAPGSNCTPTVSYSLLKPDGTTLITSSTSLSFLASGIPDGSYTLVIKGYCNGKTCDSCAIPLIKKCKDCDCVTAGCKLAPEYTITDKSTSTSIKCGFGFSAKCKTNYQFSITDKCNSNSCSANTGKTITGVIKNSSGVIVYGPSPVPFNYAFATSGSYTIEYSLIINGVVCGTCTSNIKVGKCNSTPTSCTNCTASVLQTVMENANTNNNILNYTEVAQYFTFSGLPSAITQVRATVNDVSTWAVDNTGVMNEECLSCNNNPITWGSITGALPVGSTTPKFYTINGTSSIVNPTTGQNPRSVIWGNGMSILNLPNNTLTIRFGLPLPSSLSCCTRKAKICIKFVFRNDQCEECVVYKCFERDLK